MRTFVALWALSGCTAVAAVESDEQALQASPVGLSFLMRDGGIVPITLVGDAPRFLQEIDLVDSVTTSTDQGAQPTAELLGGVDWRGLHFVEEDWRAPGDGTWTRQRFYRGARWMEAPAVFAAVPVDDRGNPIGEPIVFDAGRDDHWNERGDDGFVRRFDVRQIVKGCRAQGDCSNATAFEVQALVQARQEQHTDEARTIPPAATALQLAWSADPTTKRTVAISHAARGALDYGFVATIELASPPANGQFFNPGDAVAFRVTFFDGAGHRLHPPGSLPTYQQSLAGDANGLRYWDPTLDATLYYALKHREANMIVQLSGPTNALAVPRTVAGVADFFAPQVTIASVANDGFTAAGVVVPPLPTILGGFSDPALWQIPISDVQTLTIAPDALPGTYTATIKGRREWGGEALNRGATIAFQVGQAAPTTFAPTTGNCGSCHADRSSLGIVNHGVDGRRSCYGCHGSLAFEPDNALDVRVHSIHSRSERFPAHFTDCSTCHLSPPSSPIARGAFIGDPD